MKKLLKIKELAVITSYSKSSIYQKLDPNSRYFDKSFPRPIRLSPTGRSAVAWVDSEVEAWVEQRIANDRVVTMKGGQ